MKKRTLIIIFVGIFVIAILFAKFTGLVVTSINTCMDSDNGKSYDVKGSVEGVYYLFTKEEYFEEDYCKDEQTLIEYYCINEDTHSYREKEEYVCEIGCENGECIGRGLRELPQPTESNYPSPLKEGWINSIINKIRSFLRI